MSEHTTTVWLQPPAWAVVEAHDMLGEDAKTDDVMRYAWQAAERDEPRDEQEQ
jgi:hypothetical protein